MLIRILLIAIVLATIVTLFTLGHWITGHILLFTAVALFHYGTLVPNSSLFGSIQTLLKNPEKPSVAITIVDGPDPEITPKLLEILLRADIKATFFLIGSKAAAHPELVTQIAEAGHSIGNHTQTHPKKSFWAAGPIRTRREIVVCQETLGKILGKPTRLFRAPVGHSNLFTHPVLRTQNLLLVGWSARGFDGLNRAPKNILRSIENDLISGAIILLHDGSPSAPEILEKTLKLIKDRNLEVTELSEP